MKRHLAVLASLSLLVLLLAGPGLAQSPRLSVPSDVAAAIQAGKLATQVYIVQMAGDPVVGYEGGIKGLAATAPAQGTKVNPNSGAVQRYVAHLGKEHGSVLGRVGAGKSKLYDYYFTFNGFSAKLTATQAAAIAAMPDVVSVEPDEVRQVTTDNSPTFLGLDAAGGVWEQLGGQESAGEDMIIGVIDTGIWPEHPSFSDQVDLADRTGSSGKRTLAYGPPPAGWHGSCDAGEQFSPDDCNNKLIGARFYRLGAAAATVITNEYLSPRDKDGHGTHTASTAGGNANVPASVLGSDMGYISGMAPRARIAAYKVCWNDVGCYLSDILKAVDQAAADGVDVINFSIGGGPALWTVETRAFLNAERAGVFVATSAGNNGPGAGTVGGPATVPWITAVGAGTQDRTFQGSVVLGNSASYNGASVTGGTDMLPLVDAADAGSELCLPGALDPGLVAGKVVLCKRGVIARVDKSRAVYLAGGAGMILYNTTDAEETVTDNHWVPSVHVNNTDGLAVKAYITAEGIGATAQIIAGSKVTGVPAPFMGAFSSRGPDVVAPDIIKPDVIAPGVNILAGGVPNPYIGATGQLFQSIGGTSMSSPHVAGVAALLRQLHPAWTPSMVKSALMTSASTDVMKEDGVTPADPFDIGAGHIAPNPAADPGLVYQTHYNEYVQFLCGSGVFSATSGTCTSFGSVDPSDLNLASIGVAGLTGVQTVQRTVTNVGPAEATYEVSVAAPPGIDVVVSPATLTIPAGGSETYSVTFSTAGATLDEWAFGSLTWSDGTHSVRSPIAVRPIALDAPGEVSGADTDGSLTYNIAFGFGGDFAAVPHGLVPAAAEAGNVADDPANDINTALGTGVGITVHAVTIPAGTEYTRFSLFDDYTDGEDDLDLYVFDPDFVFAGGSGSSTSAEEVNIQAPVAGTWYVIVHGWQTDGADANYTLFTWLLDAAGAGNMTVTAPAAATLGDVAAVTVDWSGLAAGSKYLGSVTYHDVAAPTGYTDGLLKFTIVRIDTD